jgi:peptidoglycan/LPS O-acetylase OafA/YrhL
MTTAHYGILRCLYGFGAGALCALLWRKWDECKQKPEISSSAWTIIEVFTTVFVMLFVSMFKETPFVYLAPFVFAITIFVFTHEKGRVSDFLKHKVFIFLGALSYSIYMVHYFIAGKLFIPIAKVLQAKFDIRIISMINGKERLGAEMWHGDVITMLYMIIVISCSYITFRIIEEPFRKMCRKVVYK